jgi:hypothetical protein
MEDARFAWRDITDKINVLNVPKVVKHVFQNGIVRHAMMDII